MTVKQDTIYGLICNAMGEEPMPLPSSGEPLVKGSLRMRMAMASRVFVADADGQDHHEWAALMDRLMWPDLRVVLPDLQASRTLQIHIDLLPAHAVFTDAGAALAYYLGPRRPFWRKGDHRGGSNFHDFQAPIGELDTIVRALEVFADGYGIRHRGF